MVPKAATFGTRFLDGGDGTIIGRVGWTASFVGLLLYIFVITTYRAPIGDVAVALGLVGLLLQRGGIRLPAPLIWFGVFLLWALLGLSVTRYPDVVQEALINFGKVWLIALVAVNALRTPGQIRFFMIFYLVAFATHPARGTIYNYVFGYTEFGRAAWNHIFRNPNDMAVLTLLPLAIAVGLLKDRNRWIRLGAKASIVVLPLVILFTQSRGVFIALALFALLVWSGQRRKLRGLALLGVVGAVVVLASPSGVWERVSALASGGTEADSSSQQRWAIWHIAGNIISDHPITGVGLGAYPNAHEIYAPSLPIAQQADAGGKRDTHSTYLNVIAAVGYTGFFIFLALLGSTVLFAERARRKAKNTTPITAEQIWYLEAALFAFLVAGLFGSYVHLPFLYLHIALLAALARVADGAPARVPVRRSVRRRQAPVVQPAGA